MVYEAVEAADSAGFNFALYDQDGDCYVDAVVIIHQGTGEEASGTPTDIWSHNWSLLGAWLYGKSNHSIYVTNDDCLSDPSQKVKVNDYTIQGEKLIGNTLNTVGTFAHEYGHILGLADLYDTDDSSEGIGKWSLMASGSWTYVTTHGDRPAHLDAWSKYYLGWISPKVVLGTLQNEPIQSASTNADVYKLGSGNPLSGEYFLIENRQKTGFDAGLPGSGLLIWHIDGNKINATIASNTVNDSECYPGGTPCNVNHYGVALVQADNAWHLEKNLNRGDAGDPFPGSGGNASLNDTTLPDTKFYNGSSSNVSITSISPSSAAMTATLSWNPFNPVPDIRANGSDLPIIVKPSDIVTLAVNMNAGSSAGMNADWWVTASTPYGWYSYNLSTGWHPGVTVTYQGPLFNLSPMTETYSDLPAGTYTIFGGVDMNMNGVLDNSVYYYDSITVSIIP
ncbi:MAG: M6 family metalloprotease domain-containing protein [Thermodesulfovibrionales bacterium]|nr:M6 family metalloprotease domain-containing protein [Thermodesulfovibrionales bacterium]